MANESGDDLSLFAISQYLSDEIGELKQQSSTKQWPDKQVRVFLGYDPIERALEYVIEAYDDETEIQNGTAFKVSENYDDDALKSGKIHFALDELFSEYEEGDTYFEEALIESIEDNIVSPVNYEGRLINLPPTLSPFRDPRQEV